MVARNAALRAGVTAPLLIIAALIDGRFAMRTSGWTVAPKRAESSSSETTSRPFQSPASGTAPRTFASPNVIGPPGSATPEVVVGTATTGETFEAAGSVAGGGRFVNPSR